MPEITETLENTELSKPPRSFYLDNTRTYLTALVILHHSSIAYGGLGNWAYRSRYHALGSSPTLIAFNATNQTYFMATFYLLSGYFSAIAASKRSRRSFLRDKWKRLGVPTLVYSVLGPGIRDAVMAVVRDGAGWTDGLINSWEGVKSVRGVRGAVWYCALLLIFDISYALLRPDDFGKTYMVTGGPWTVPARAVFFALSVTSMASYLLRSQWSEGALFEPLNLNPGYVPQYILFYTTGVLAYARYGTELHFLIKGPTRIMLVVLSVLIWLAGTVLSWVEIHRGADAQEVLKLAGGGFHSLAFIYAAWNEIMGVLLSSLVLQLFRMSFEERWRVGGTDLARFSYSAFLVHIPVVVFLQCLLDSWNTSGVLKSLVVGIPGVIGSWGVGWVLVRVLESTGCVGYV